ncbi:MAG: Tat pathway signal protein, partial [Xanthomonas perforans]|nr:Tat pathway signal protein [Xanthomonas perforans]
LLGFISYGYAQQLLRLDRIEEYLLFVYAHRYQVHTRGSWTAGEVSGITGGMPLFCIPAQMTIPLLLRWMLVSDDSAGEQLFLARAL